MFINYIDIKLKDLFRGIGKAASQYYDDIETKTVLNNTTMVMR